MNESLLFQYGSFDKLKKPFYLKSVFKYTLNIKSVKSDR